MADQNGAYSKYNLIVDTPLSLIRILIPWLESVGCTPSQRPDKRQGVGPGRQPPMERGVRCSGWHCSRCPLRSWGPCPSSGIVSSNRPNRRRHGRHSGAGAERVHNRLPVREQINSF